MPRSESYHTKARQEILNYLKGCRGTVSAADIIQQLKENGISVNPTTVYRYLDKLCSDHAAMKYVANKGGKAVYQLTGQDQHCLEHLHLRCIKCGRIIHLDCGFMEEFKGHLQEHHDFRLQCEGSVLYGVCSGCSKGEER
ncbi:MAG: transcriptional repressor [Intestinimonas sp.]|jgi:Fur family ferric uptake transcriptional regulator|nr:transcriptional repressor [Intestinimonas sp.]